MRPNTIYMNSGDLSSKEVAQAIKNDLLKNNITIAEAAERIGKPAQSLYNLMKGRHRIGHQMAKLLHEEFAYSVLFLTQGKGPMFDFEDSDEQEPIDLFRDYSPEELNTPRERLMDCIKQLIQKSYFSLSNVIRTGEVFPLSTVFPEECGFEYQSERERELFIEITLWEGMLRPLLDPKFISRALECVDSEEQK